MGNQNSGRPGGHPNIKNFKRTGPVTPEGQAQNALAQILKRTIHGKYARTLYALRQCNYCPLGERKIKANDKEIIIPAKCKYYKPDNRDCPVGVPDFIKRVNANMEAMKSGNLREYMLQVIQDQRAKSELSEQMEVMEKGKPGWSAIKFAELADKNMQKLYEIDQKREQAILQAQNPQQTNIQINVVNDLIKTLRQEFKPVIAEKENIAEKVDERNENEKNTDVQGVPENETNHENNTGE